VSVSSCFIAAGIIWLFIQVLEEASRRNLEAAEKIRQIPATYTPTVRLSLRTTPVLPNGERVFVGGFLKLSISQAAPREDAIEEFTARATEAISVWALGLADPKDALKPEAYDSLRDRLSLLSADFASVKVAAITTIAPLKRKMVERVTEFQRLLKQFGDAKQIYSLQEVINQEPDEELRGAYQYLYNEAVKHYKDPTEVRGV
jgi:hypothetical protein